MFPVAPDARYRPHHSPTFDFDESALAYGMETMRAAVLEALGRRSL